MRWIAAGICAALMMVAPVSAQESPFAVPSEPGDDDLGAIMTLIQMRHIKLWFAGQSGNWGLAGYELLKIKKNLGRAAMLYRNIPIEEVEATGQALTHLQGAVDSRNRPDFSKAFNQLTAGCNSCHTSGGVDFIRIQTPTAQPFSNEAFNPIQR